MTKFFTATFFVLVGLVGATILATKSGAQASTLVTTHQDQWPPKAADMVNLVVQGVNVPINGRVTLTTVPPGRYLVITSYRVTETTFGVTEGSLRLREVLNGTDTLKCMWDEANFAGFDGHGAVFAPGSDVVLDNTTNPAPNFVPGPFIGDMRLMGYLASR